MSEYIKEKIKVLRDFDIKLDRRQLQHVKSLKNEYEIDRYIRPIILETLS